MPPPGWVAGWEVWEAPGGETGIAGVDGEGGAGEEAAEEGGVEGAGDEGAAEGGDVVFVVGSEEAGVYGEEEAGEGVGTEEKVEEGAGGQDIGDFVEDFEGEGEEWHWGPVGVYACRYFLFKCGEPV